LCFFDSFDFTFKLLFFFIANLFKDNKLKGLFKELFGAYLLIEVNVDILNKIYDTCRKVADNFKENMKIMFDEYLPNWNYRAVPVKFSNG